MSVFIIILLLLLGFVFLTGGFSGDIGRGNMMIVGIMFSLMLTMFASVYLLQRFVESSAR